VKVRYKVVTREVSQVVSGWLNAIAKSKVSDKVVTSEVFQVVSGWLNAAAP